VYDFPLFPGSASATDIGMVGGPGYDVERPSARYAVSILFSRECRGWAFEAMRWHRIVQRCAEIMCVCVTV